MSPRHRMSSLPIVQFCAPAGALGSISRGRSAAMSSAFHATASNQANRLVLLSKLTDAEMQEVMTWQKPADVQVGDGGPVLKYSAAAHEVEVCLNSKGEHCDREDPDCVSVGHIDMAWVETIDGTRCVYVGDIKRSSWTTVDGPDSLQLIAYALAFASLMKASCFVTGIWSATEGEWTWGELVELEDAFGLPTERAHKLRSRVLAAIHNDSPEYHTGPHCSGCYGSDKCPAYLLPPELAETSLAPFTVEGGLNSENALQAMLLAERAADTADAMKKRLKLWVDQGGVIKDPSTGKRWGAVKCSGREGVDYEAAARLGIEIPKKRGNPYSQHRWLKS